MPDADGAQPYVSTSKDVQKQPAPEASVVTQDEMNAMQQRLQQRPQKSFEQAVLAAPQQPSVSPSL